MLSEFGRFRDIGIWFTWPIGRSIIDFAMNYKIHAEQKAKKEAFEALLNLYKKSESFSEFELKAAIMSGYNAFWLINPFWRYYQSIEHPILYPLCWWVGIAGLYVYSIGAWLFGPWWMLGGVLLVAFPIWNIWDSLKIRPKIKQIAKFL